MATESTMAQHCDTGLVSIALQLMAIGYPCLHYWSGIFFLPNIDWLMGPPDHLLLGCIIAFIIEIQTHTTSLRQIMLMGRLVR